MTAHILRSIWFTPSEYLQGDAEAALAALEARNSAKAHALLIASLKANGFDCELGRWMLQAANCLLLGDPLMAMQVLRGVAP